MSVIGRIKHYLSQQQTRRRGEAEPRKASVRRNFMDAITTAPQ